MQEKVAAFEMQTAKVDRLLSFCRGGAIARLCSVNLERLAFAGGVLDPGVAFKGVAHLRATNKGAS